ncbi:MAG TPA: acyl carrier protein [Streptosporangiaceae bacterium]|nr:acyl carrier protein [Streptosporangiaceae bacterium]
MTGSSSSAGGDPAGHDTSGPRPVREAGAGGGANAAGGANVADGAGVPGGDVVSVADDLRAVLATATGRDELLHIPPTAALFGTGVGLDSLTGTLLLREIQRRFGVDVAAEDLNLDSLATLGTLAAFVAQRVREGDSA